MSVWRQISCGQTYIPQVSFIAVLNRRVTTLTLISLVCVMSMLGPGWSPKLKISSFFFVCGPVKPLLVHADWTNISLTYTSRICAIELSIHLTNTRHRCRVRHLVSMATPDVDHRAQREISPYSVGNLHLCWSVVVVGCFTSDQGAIRVCSAPLSIGEARPGDHFAAVAPHTFQCYFVADCVRRGVCVWLDDDWFLYRNASTCYHWRKRTQQTYIKITSLQLAHVVYFTQAMAGVCS